MKRLFLATAFLFLASSVEAQVTRSVAESNLVGLGMSPQLATEVAALGTGNGVIPNNAYLYARNAAGTANISVLKVDATDDTVLNADTGDTIKLSIAGTAEVTVDDDQVTFSGAAVQVVPGATSLTFRNNADDASNLVITDAGLVTLRSDLALGTSGGTIAFQEATSGAKCMGSVTANGTTAVPVATTCATTGSRIFAFPSGDQTGTTTAHCWATNIQNGVSFDFDCDGTADSNWHWVIFHEAA